ncbi:PhnO protein [Mobilisporobacter senegalensis]|uniref:PhnO protein n=1 Tax=Mobilisporobacter senegalensis TaxID=1329262 RepID=A0A3N1XPX3_9FIRM|nr:GNAT family N-acetyltransferase [Mobilisporobacter senegalensis]ROR28221.1 PhnO protein [Mobilisporobacter senegalensis]
MESLRKATLNDKEQIYGLLVALEETSIDIKRFSDIFDANISNPSVFYYVYEKEYVILGFISIHVQKLLHHTANIAEIQELIVDETVRYQGIGKRLFQKAKEVGTDNDCKQLEVCCNQKRVFSHKFYQSQGMTNSHYKFCLTL